MRMWSSNEKVTPASFDTLVSNKAEIVGDLKFSGGLHIDGKVVGNILADSNTSAVVRVSDKGVVEGEIRAPNVIINGRVTGDVHSTEHLELAKNASVQGDVFYNMMEMVMGAEVNGSLVNVNSSEKEGEEGSNEVLSLESRQTSQTPAEVG